MSEEDRIIVEFINKRASLRMAKAEVPARARQQKETRRDTEEVLNKNGEGQPNISIED